MQQIYLHGLGQTPNSWEKTIMQLESAAHSECPNLAKLIQGQDVTYQNLYKAFSKICDSFDLKINLCGLSLGGVLALNYACEHPEKVNSLVLIATQYKMPKGLLRIQNILFQFMPKNMFQQTGFSKVNFLQLCKTMMELDFSNFIRKITCPTLVICGEKDSANKKAAEELARIMKNAEFQVINDSGHEVNIDAPEKLAETLRVFYKQV
ncbi:MAG: alpha/beta hydrolase [Butyrivibrio sp.]|nr:alpha/beta hydrolase [Butyrivibrio sp.]